jgi:uncharacterized damage-inducible protein DinB
VTPKLQEVFDAARARLGRLYELLRACSEAQACFRPAAEKWSIGELARHVALAQGGILRTIRKRLDEAEAAEVAPDLDTSSALGSLDFLREGAQARLASPRSLVPEHGHPLDETLRALRAQEAELEALLPRLARRDLTRLKFAHPFFGELDVYQWILFLGAHAARHAGQMADVRTHPGFPAA